MRNNKTVTGNEHPMQGDRRLVYVADIKGKIACVNQDSIEMRGFPEEKNSQK